MRILITGGTGLIGSYLVRDLLKDGHHLSLLTRNKKAVRQAFSVPLPQFNQISESLEEFDFNQLDAVINLAGEPIVNKRWSDAQKQVLCHSRWDITSKIAEYIRQAQTPPKVFISGSAIGLYGRQDDDHVDETFTAFNPEFTHTLCKEWETRAFSAESDKTRVCVLRTGIVLEEKSGALAKMLPAFRMGLGGPISHGRQGMSWIHIQDMVALIKFLLTNETLSGVFNATAPEPVSNSVFSKTLANTLGRPCLFRVPGFTLKMAMGEMAELLLFGQFVYPRRLLDAGFQFKYKSLAQALAQLLEKKDKS